MDKFKITVANESIYLFTDSIKVINLIRNKIESIAKTIPCDVSYVGSTSFIDENNNYIYYHNSDVGNININTQSNICHLSLSDNKLFFPDIVYLLLCMFANIFQYQNKYFLQASVVKYDDNDSIMFLGQPNTGKTTLSSKLILTGNWSLVSNDNVLVGTNNNKLFSITGTKKVQMRYAGLKNFFPEIPINNFYHKDIGKRDEWDIKIYVDEYFKEKNIKYSNHSNITDIFLINTNKSEEIIIRKKEKIDQLLVLYEELTKQIRSNRYLLTSFDCPIPSFENEEYLNERYNIAKKIVESTDVYDLKGDIDKAVLRLRKKYEK